MQCTGRDGATFLISQIISASCLPDLSALSHACHTVPRACQPKATARPSSGIPAPNPSKRGQLTALRQAASRVDRMCLCGQCTGSPGLNLNPCTMMTTGPVPRARWRNRAVALCGLAWTIGPSSVESIRSSGIPTPHQIWFYVLLGSVCDKGMNVRLRLCDGVDWRCIAPYCSGVAICTGLWATLNMPLNRSRRGSPRRLTAIGVFLRPKWRKE